MQTKLDVKKIQLSNEERSSYLTQALVFIQSDKPLSLPYNLQTQSADSLISGINFRHDVNDDAFETSMDTLLFVIHEHRCRVPWGVYLKLMHACEMGQNHIAAYQIAHFLHNNQRFIHVDVIRILLLSANETGKPEEACHIFDENYAKLPDKDYLSKELLYVEYVRSLALLGQVDKAFALCLNKIKTFYALTYDIDRMCFVGENGRIQLDDECWGKPGLQGFCLQLAMLFSRKKNKQDVFHAVEIVETLHQLRPDIEKYALRLSLLYKTTKQTDKAKALLSGYLQTYPHNVRVCVHYITFLIEINEINQARMLCEVFIDNYSKQHADLRKIKLLWAWFHEQPALGKALFDKLIQEFPYHSMIIYLAIRYSFKIRDETWRIELMAYASIQFAAEPQLLELIVAFSKARMICAAIESQPWTKPNDLLQENPNPLLQSRHCKIPDVVANAFERFCTCETKPCEGNCLDAVYLTGSAVCLCLDADKSANPLDRNQLNDLDFVMQVPEIPTEPLFAGFKFSPHVLNLLTYKSPNASSEPDIDLMLYISEPGNEDSPHDITSMIKDMDVTINRLFMDKNGVVWDCLGGEALKAYDGNYLKIHGDALAALQHDPARVLRIIKKIVRYHYHLDSSLEEALYTFQPASWFDKERLRKKFAQMLMHTSNKQYISLMQTFNLLGPDINSQGTQDEVLQRCLVRFAEYCQANQLSEQLDSVISDQTKLNTTIRRQIKRLELQQQIKQLEQDINEKRANVHLIQTNVNNVNKQINKKSNKLFNEWQIHQDEINKNNFDTLQANIVSIVPSLKTLSEQENNTRSAISLVREQVDVVARWQMTIDSSQQRRGFFKEAVEVNDSLPIKRNVFKMSKNLAVDTMRDMLNYSSNDMFTAFICLNLGCFYWYADENNNPLLAWYYLKQVETYVLSYNNREPQIQSFFEISLTPILQQAFNACKLDSMTEKDLLIRLKQSKLADERSALIEYYLSKQEWRASAMKQALQSDAYRQSDFMRFIALYDEMLTLNKGRLQQMDETIVNTIANGIKVYFNKDSCKTLNWFSYIKQLKILFKYPDVYKKVMQALPSDHQEELLLELYKKSETVTPEGDCLRDIHLAESYLTMPYDRLKMNLPRAIAYYEKIVELLSLSTDHPDYVCIYAWAYARLNTLIHEKDRVVRLTDDELFVALMPLFYDVLMTWTPTDSKSVKLFK